MLSTAQFLANWRVLNKDCLRAEILDRLEPEAPADAEALRKVLLLMVMLLDLK